jgi:regulator of protease activity HflC (stomatin/prohibitin superfamily)
MVRDLLNFLILFAWLALLIVAVRQVVRAARKYRKLLPALRTLFSYRWLIYTSSVSILTLVKASLVFVYPQQAGVVVSIFSDDGVRAEPLRGGLHWVVPLAERLVVYPLYWQSYDMSRQSSEHPGGGTVPARTRDGQEVDLDCTIIFRIDPRHVVPIHIQWQDRYIRDLVHPVLRGVLRDQISRYTVEQLNSVNRQELVAGMEQALREIGGKNGLIVKAFLPRNLAFVRQYTESVEKKQIALEKQRTREYQAKSIELLARGREQRVKILAAARAEAVVIKAEARKQARIIKKNADAKALGLVRAVLADNPHMLTYRYIEQLPPKLRVMILKQGEAPVILPKGDLEPVSPSPAGGRRPG